MARLHLLRPSLCALLLGTAFACSSDDADDPQDAAVTADAGQAAADTGAVEADSGVEPADSGAEPADSGAEPADAGNPPADVGATVDASAAQDAGPADAGATSDAGSANSHSVMISAASGGTVSFMGMTLDVPAGALAQDTVVTVEVSDGANLPDPGNTPGMVFDLGPDGLSFLTPVTLQMPLPATPPQGMEPTLAYLDSGQWVRLTDAAESGGVVSATTDHFTPFTVRWIAGMAFSDCDDLEMQFMPCGGDVVGTWDYELGCADFQSPFAGTALEMCAGFIYEATVDLTGVSMINADNTYSVTQDFTLTQYVTFPHSCLPQGVTCANYNVPDTGTHCENTTVTPIPSNSTGTWMVSGPQLTTTSSTGDVGTVDYCVMGDTLAVRVVDDTTFYYTGRRR